MAKNNSTILARAWLNGSNDFQQRVPNPTQAGIKRTMNFLLDPMNGDYYNQFINILVNRIAATYIHQTVFENPLAAFKKGMMSYGNTVQEAAIKWIKAHAYDDESGAELLKLERPEAAVWYHSQNRRDKYPISVSYDELRSAFADEFGLNRLIAAITETPRNSDNYDEYRIMMQLIGEYIEKWGMFTENMALPTDEATGKAFLTKLRSYAGLLTFPSTKYSAAQIDVPITVKPDELVLLITPDANASLDVNTLAGLFNVDYAAVKYRIVLVDEFPVPDMYALLTTDAFFACWDTVYRTGTFWNEDNLTQKHYLHHWGIYSISPFVPAIAFRTEAAGTLIPTITETVTGFSLDAAEKNVKPGSVVQLIPTIQGNLNVTDADGMSIDASKVHVAPDAATYELNAARQGGEGFQLNGRTFVDFMGRLNIQKSGLKKGDTITVTGTSTYTNPSGKTTAQTDDVTITISEDSK